MVVNLYCCEQLLQWVECRLAGRHRAVNLRDSGSSRIELGAEGAGICQWPEPRQTGPGGGAGESAKTMDGG